jgi:serine/threonine protein kinase
MALALQEVHQAGVAHRDIKLENYLFDGEYRVKLADFGHAHFIARVEEKILGAGTSFHCAKEAIDLHELLREIQTEQTRQ